jgi:excisionase family DNA binding protein
LTTKTLSSKPESLPLLKTVEQMSKISGLGENKFRELMDKGEIDYISVGNRRLLSDESVWDWYERNKFHVASKEVINHGDNTSTSKKQTRWQW